jgi:hypothetical protein
MATALAKELHSPFRKRNPHKGGITIEREQGDMGPWIMP